MLPQPSTRHFQSIVCACTKARSFRSALSTNDRLCRNGLQAHAWLGSSLLAMLAEVGSLRNAMKIFHALPADDESKWNHLINGYLKHGEERAALLVYQEMHDEWSFLPSSHTLVALLKTCTKLKDLNIGKLIHHQLTRFRIADVYSGGALVDFYAKCGFLEKARQVFDTLPVLGIVIWNILIGGYVGHGSCKEALDAFNEMQAKGVCPDAVTYVLILKCSSNFHAKERCSILHRIIATEGLLSNNCVRNALINMFAESGLLEDAQDLFQGLSQKNVGTWNALIAGYAKHECSKEALDLFYQMSHEGVHPNDVTFTSLLTACCSDVAIDTITEVYCEIERRGLLRTNVFVGSALVHMFVKHGVLAKARDFMDLLPARNVVTWNALIAGYADDWHSEEALHCLEHMKLEGVSPNLVTYACILKACGATGLVDKGIEIHEELAKKGFEGKSLFLGSALVAMYAKCGALAKAQDVFDMLPVRNVVTWSALMSGYAQCGRVEKALLMFRNMINEGHEPDQAAFSCILTACSHAGLVETAQSYYAAICRSYGIPPCFGHHTCMIDLFGRAGQIQNAAEIMNKAPFCPDSVALVSLLGSCRKWGNVEQGRHTFEQTIRLDEMAEGAYVCMYNMYADTNIVKNDKCWSDYISK